MRALKILARWIWVASLPLQYVGMIVAFSFKFGVWAAVVIILTLWLTAKPNS